MQVCDECEVEFCNGKNCPKFEYELHGRKEQRMVKEKEKKGKKKRKRKGKGKRSASNKKDD